MLHEAIQFRCLTNDGSNISWGDVVEIWLVQRFTSGDHARQAGSTYKEYGQYH